MCKYARLVCMLDIIMCSGVNSVLINWNMLKTIMGELKSGCNWSNPYHRLTWSACFCFEVLDPWIGYFTRVQASLARACALVGPGVATPLLTHAVIQSWQWSKHEFPVHGQRCNMYRIIIQRGLHSLIPRPLHWKCGSGLGTRLGSSCRLLKNHSWHTVK